jgi:hypothetical protein
MVGWIKIHRKLIDWEWYDDANTFRLFIHCLLKCNHEPKHWRGVNVERGTFITSNNKLSKELKLSIKQIRLSINKLKRTNEIAIESTNQFTIIQVIKYDDYQDEGTQQGKRGANKGQQLKNVKNDKEDKMSEFDRFWNYYGKKVDRKKCESKWLRLSNKDIESIKLTIANYIESTPDIKFRKNPLTYLNGESWNDDVTTIIPEKKTNEQIQYENIMAQIEKNKGL